MGGAGLWIYRIPCYYLLDLLALLFSELAVLLCGYWHVSMLEYVFDYFWEFGCLEGLLELLLAGLLPFVSIEEDVIDREHRHRVGALSGHVIVC